MEHRLSKSNSEETGSRSVLEGLGKKKSPLLTSSRSPFDHFKTRRRHSRPDWEPGAGPGGGEGAKLGDIYPTTFGELFESRAQPLASSQVPRHERDAA